MRKLSTVNFFLLCLLLQNSAFSYDIPSHFDMSDEAVKRSVLSKDPSVAYNFGSETLGRKYLSAVGVNSTELTNDCERGKYFAFNLLIACGAQFEDVPGTRSLNHFYDPISGVPLTIGGVKPGAVLGMPNLTSPDWTLQDAIAEKTDAQEFSYKDARGYFFKALTAAGPQKDRDVFWGKTFQSIGQVIHHIQDMAQPQHVRNDQHLDMKIPLLYNPSLYEEYTRIKRTELVLFLSSLPVGPIYTADNPGPFKTPRDFWRNASGTGLAELTNKNFVSAGTNFELSKGVQVAVTKYALPAPGTLGEPVAVDQLVPSAPQETFTYCGGNCGMSFISTNDNTPAHNSRAAALSIFDQYVRTRPVKYSRNVDSGMVEYETDRIFTLNQYTIDEAHKKLLPAAIAYSAGLINFFFRGKMEISLPDDGVYGIIDHATNNAKDTGGFSQIKLRLKNTTPDGAGGIEPMAAGGKLVAVAKFRRNNCYKSDLGGEYGSPGIDWQTCRAKEEEIVVSATLDSSAEINTTDGKELSFNFNPPIPINATDLFLQVVFRGKLGAEEDAVAVTTRDISEPTYYYRFVAVNRIDFPDDTWTGWCLRNYPSVDACESATGYTILPAAGPDADPLFGYDPAFSAVPPGTWGELSAMPPLNALAVMQTPTESITRIAQLLDPQIPSFWMRVEQSLDPYNNHAEFSWNYCITCNITINQLDPVKNIMTISNRYQKARGIFVAPQDAANLITVTGGAVLPDLRLLPSTIAPR